MSYDLQWRKALILSVIFHVFLIIGAGYAVTQLPVSQAAEEKYVELELMNTVEPETLTAALSPAAPMTTSQISQSPPLSTLKPSTPSSASPSPSSNATPVVSTEGLTVTSVNGNSGITSSAVAGETNAKTTGTQSNGSSIMPPSILHKVEPAYPQSARQSGIEGTVILTIQIYENGLPGKIAIFRSSGNDELDNAAISTVKQWRFAPAKDRTTNQPISCYTKMPISFHLK